ncbi:hypothetical protein ACPX19_10185 [Winogradskyella sp. HB-48]|uniref:hypothetical protein n=1 Tax=Winogradskyella sp. HB-48 TaxID=3416808 RepID=UPI003CF44FE0
MKIKVISFLICLTLLSCKKEFSSPELEKHFTESQVEDLNKIRLFFINDIINLDINNFHKNFINEVEKMEASGSPYIPKKKIDSVLSSISADTFNEIWEKHIDSTQFKDKIYNYLLPKYQGKYQIFLADISKKNKAVNHYYQRMNNSGDFNRLSMLGYIKEHPKEFDLKNVNIQILLAIQYISVLRDPFN